MRKQKPTHQQHFSYQNTDRKVYTEKKYVIRSKPLQKNNPFIKVFCFAGTDNSVTKCIKKEVQLREISGGIVPLDIFSAMFWSVPNL